MIKAVAFDVGGVLQLEKELKNPVRGHITGVHEIISRKLKISLDNWIDATDIVYAKSIEGKISKKKALSTIASHLNITTKKLRYTAIKAYQKYFRKNNQLFNLAVELRKNGYKTAILSDQWYLSNEALISKEDRKKFNSVIISCEVGFRKPSKAIYKYAIKKLKLKPKEILFIDNRNWNIIPAQKLGIKTILFKNNRQAIKEIKMSLHLGRRIKIK